MLNSRPVPRRTALFIMFFAAIFLTGCFSRGQESAQALFGQQSPAGLTGGFSAEQIAGMNCADLQAADSRLYELAPDKRLTRPAGKQLAPAPSRLENRLFRQMIQIRARLYLACQQQSVADLAPAPPWQGAQEGVPFSIPGPAPEDRALPLSLPSPPQTLPQAPARPPLSLPQ